MGVELPPRLRLTPKVGKSSGGMCGCGGGGSSLMVDEEADADNASITREDMVAAFHRIDTDGSGTLDRKEVKETLTNMMSNVEEEEIDKMVSAMDADHNGEIDMDEFVDTMMMVANAPEQMDTQNSDDDDSDLDELQMSLAKLQASLLSDVNE